MAKKSAEPIGPPRPVRPADCVDWAVVTLSAVLEGLESMPADQRVRLSPAANRVLRVALSNYAGISCKPHPIFDALTLRDLTEVLRRLRAYLRALEDAL
jgi:hypothetical protein